MNNEQWISSIIFVIACCHLPIHKLWAIRWFCKDWWYYLLIWYSLNTHTHTLPHATRCAFRMFSLFINIFNINGISSFGWMRVNGLELMKCQCRGFAESSKYIHPPTGTLLSWVSRTVDIWWIMFASRYIRKVINGTLTKGQVRSMFASWYRSRRYVWGSICALP